MGFKATHPFQNVALKAQAPLTLWAEVRHFHAFEKMVYDTHTREK